MELDSEPRFNGNGNGKQGRVIDPLGFLKTKKTLFIFMNFSIIVIYTLAYWWLIRSGIDDFRITEEDLGRKPIPIFDAFYHSFVVHGTIGFGDSAPKKVLGRAITISHILTVFVVNIFLIPKDIGVAQVSVALILIGISVLIVLFVVPSIVKKEMKALCKAQ